MKSYTVGRNLYGRWTKNTNSTNLSHGDEVANDTYQQICARKDWPFLERVRTILTTASTQFKNLPYDCDQVREVSVIPTGSTTRYTPRLSPSAEHWDRLNLSTFTSDTPQWYFIRNGQIGLWPTPASSNNTIYITQRTKVIDLSVADYTTGTIVSIASGATTVTGSGTAWTAQMTGRYIRITYLDTANTGDGQWYEISSVTSATVLELVRAYGGTSISAGSAAYNMGQFPLLPSAFHDMPWLSAAGDYWSKETDDRADYYISKYATLDKLLEKSWSTPTGSMVIDDGRSDEIINPNLTISI